MSLRAWRAALRHLLLVCGVLFFITFLAWPRPVLIRVELTDFAQMQQDLPGWDDARRLPLERFIETHTEGRLRDVQGAEWERLFQRCRQASEGLWLRPDELPDRFFETGQMSNFVYVRLTAGPEPVFMDLTAVRPSDYGRPPAALRYPLRPLGGWIALATLLGYLLITWPKPRPDTVDYVRFQGIVLPDILGVMLVAVFFGLPWLIVPSTCGVSNPLDPAGLAPLTIVSWGLGLFGVVIIFIAARTEAWCLTVAPQGLIIETLTRSETLSWDQIESLSVEPVEAPRWLVRLGLLMSLVNWRAAGPTLLMAGRSDSRLVLRLKNGRTYPVVLTCLRNFERLVKAVDEAGLPTPAMQ